MAPAYEGGYWWTIVVGIQVVAHLFQFHLLVVDGFTDGHLIIEHAHNFGITLGELLLDLWSIEHTTHNANELKD